VAASRVELSGYSACQFEHMGVEQARFGPGLTMRERLSGNSPKA